MAVFRLRLNNPLIVQGVKNRLYVIQFTRYRRASERKLLDYITFDSVCQELFSIFSKLFRADSLLAALVSNSDILAQMLSFVKNFLHFLTNFFIFSLTPSLSRTASVYYHMHLHLSRGNCKILALIFSVLRMKVPIPILLVL